jgi:hypothetical protein
MHRLMVILSVGVVGAHCGALGAEPPYMPLPKTDSPDGLHLFAWSFPAKLKVNWESLVQGNPRALPKNFEDQVINCLVDSENHKIVATIPKAQAFEVDGVPANHRDLAAAWSPKSDFAVTIYSEKWGYTTFTGFHVTPRAAAIVDLGKPLEAAYREELSATAGPRYNP